MGDLAESIHVRGSGSQLGARREILKRRKEFAKLRVFMPRVLSRHYSTGEWRPFDYDRDLLSRLEWSEFGYTKRKNFMPDEQEAIVRTLIRVNLEDLRNDAGSATFPNLETTLEAESEIDSAGLARLLLDVMPNPWHGVRILNETISELRRRKFSEARIAANRLFLVKAIKDDLQAQIHEASEAEFRRMLSAGELRFQLDASNDPRLNWKLAETLEIDVSDEDKPLRRRNGEELEKSFFAPVYQKQVNGLEKDVAWYLDADKAVRWWHRIAVHQDWYLQGWQRNRVYPDFLACLHESGNGKVRFTVLETKGLHLLGSEDTEYKAQLFELLSQHAQQSVPVGELKLELEKQQLSFKLMLANNWREALPKALAD
jgi:type III restriction enzyme